jgi:hypothetical protein
MRSYESTSICTRKRDCDVLFFFLLFIVLFYFPNCFLVRIWNRIRTNLEKIKNKMKKVAKMC